MKWFKRIAQFLGPRCRRLSDFVPEARARIATRSVAGGDKMIVAGLRKAYVAAKLSGGSRLTTRARHSVATAARYEVPGNAREVIPSRRDG
jgi:hypothetical protein